MLLGPVLTLVNGPVMQDALRDPNNRINKLAAAQKDDTKLIEELFLATLCRLPTPQESKRYTEQLRQDQRESKKDFEELQAEKARRAKALADHEKALMAKLPEWEKRFGNTPVWVVLQPEEMKSAKGAKLKKLPDGSVFASGKNAGPETYTITAKTDLTGITAIRLEVLSDSRLPARGPGRAPNGNLVLSEFKVTAEPDKGKAGPVALHNAKATFSQQGFEVAKAIDNNPGTGWALAGPGQLGKNHAALFETKGQVGFTGGTKLTFTLEQRHSDNVHNIGRLRLAVTTAKPPVPLQEVLPAHIAKILHKTASQRTAAEQSTLVGYYRSTDAELGRLQRAADEFVVPADARALAAQDIAWALMNSPGFLFNH
jgi:hypothetical protein